MLLSLAATVISAIAFMELFDPMFGGLGLLIIVGIYYLAHRFSCKFNREYEYIITKDVVDIDVIYNASSRKRLISFSVHEVETIAPANGNNMPDKGDYSKVINATTNTKNAEIYYVVAEKEGKVLVLFEPPYTMLEIMKKLEPRKVTIKEQ